MTIRLRMGRRQLVDYSILLLITMAAVWIRIPKLDSYISTDDGIYAASCWLMKLGYRPYVDFTLVQPPLFYWIVLALWNITNLSDPFQLWTLAKLVSLTSFIANTFLIYLTCNRRLGNPNAGLVGALIYQFSYDSYNYSVSSCPQVLATLFMVAAVYMLLSDGRTTRHFLLTGICLGLAAITRFSAFLLIPAFLAYLLWQIRKGRVTREMAAFAAIGLLIPLLSLLTVPFDALKRDLIVYHATKSVTPTPIQVSVTGLVGDFTTKEPPNLLGSISLIYTLSKRDQKHTVVSGAAVFLLMTYLAQPVLTSQHLIESIPFFSIIAALGLTGFTVSIDKESRRKMIVMTICLILVALYFVPENVYYGKRALGAHSFNHVLKRLVDSTQRYSNSDEMVFSQVSVIPFLAGRRCPPIADIDWVNLEMGLFTAENVMQLVQNYPLKVVVITHRTEMETRDFLERTGYTRVERIDMYRVYVKGV